jgi:hypothetical protein
MLNLATHSGFSLVSEPLLDGDAGTQQTIARIRNLVDQGIKDPLVNKMAGTILRAARVRPYDELGEIRALFAYVLDPRNIRFTKDPDGKETLRPASTILEWGFGDCDDINAILLPSLLGTVGYRTRLVTIASDARDPQVFTHVYCEVLYRGRWIPLDAARKGTRFGSAPRRQYRARAWSLVADEYEDLKGLAGMGECLNCTASARRMRLGSQMRLGRTYPSSGLGQNWGDIAGAITAATAGTANIIRSSSGQPQFVYPSSAAYPPPGGYGAPAPSASGSVQISPGLAIIGGLTLLALLARKG